MPDRAVDGPTSGLNRRSFLGLASLIASAGTLPTGAHGQQPNLTPAAAPMLAPPRSGAKQVPLGFMWGVSTSGHQIEGNNTNADCWLMENVKPTTFTERSGDANDSLNRYQEDIDLLKMFGFNSYRFSIEWSRIEPNEGYFSIAALDHYKRMIAYCHKAGVNPAVSFNHYAMPIWFAASGGLLRPDGPDLFARFCKLAAEHLADGMHVAFTLNEPNGGLIGELLFGSRKSPVLAPMTAAAAKSVGSDRFITWSTASADALLLPAITAHKQAYAAIKSVRGDLPVGVTLATIDYQGVGPNNRAEEFRQKIDGAWLEAAKTGDFVGVQNYFPLKFDSKGLIPLPVNANGAPPPPELVLDAHSLANTVRAAHASTGKPILVTEHGIDTTDDALRITYTTETLGHLGEAMAEGIPVLGYFHWSLLDNYEWGSYKPRYGIVAVDRTSFTRTPKPSAEYLGAFARRNIL